jgi:hypothetical protein
MAEKKSIEQRLAALEEAVRELQSRLPPVPAEKWWEKIPPVSNLEAFEKAMEYGREYRYADRPSDEDEPDKQS